jgi:hypothetical protein
MVKPTWSLPGARSPSDDIPILLNNLYMQKFTRRSAKQIQTRHIAVVLLVLFHTTVCLTGLARRRAHMHTDVPE